MDRHVYLFEKLAQALYTHAKQAAEAEQAHDAVEYLEDKGIFTEDS